MSSPIPLVARQMQPLDHPQPDLDRFIPIADADDSQSRAPFPGPLFIFGSQLF
jgi:hypothetical protein